LKITTNKISDWEDFIYSEHKLPLIVKQHQEDQFFSDMSIIPVIFSDDVSFAESQSVKQIIESRPISEFKDSFLIAHSMTAFCYENNVMRQNVKNGSFALDLSNSFSGEFLTDCHTKSFSIPFDLLPGNIVDQLKTKQLEQHPLYFTIESLLRSITASDKRHNISHKVAAIINMISIDDFVEKKDFISDIEIYLIKKMLKGEKINLDTVARDFCMSRRKIQYVFTENNTNYLKVINKVRMKLIKYKS
jgi:AraC-like DNA-binding protein